MSRVTGQVFKVYDKNFRGKMLYSVKLENLLVSRGKGGMIEE